MTADESRVAATDDDPTDFAMATDSARAADEAESVDEDAPIRVREAPTGTVRGRSKTVIEGSE
ncbi:MAG: hypothetical protein ACOCZD_02135 [Haloferacaceae archaeon]